MKPKDEILDRVRRLADELGSLADQVTIVGGTCPALYEMNETVSPRPTKDIDVIIRAASFLEWRAFTDDLETRGFSKASGPICRFGKADLVVDVMATAERALGFGNRWYEEAAARRTMPRSATLHVMTPIYFVATKLDAHVGRGVADPLASKDLEDIIAVLRGMPSLFTEIEQGTEAVHSEIRRTLAATFGGSDALTLVRSHLEGDTATQAIGPRLLAQIRAACS